MTTLLSTPEQSRARYPDEEGYVERDGVRVFWERYGEGEPTVLLPPTWEIVHSRFWKGQIPYLARHTRVVTFDPRGNGRSDRPDGYDAYVRREFADDALAVLDAAGVDRAVVVSWCDMGESLILAAEHPERVAGLVFIGAAVSLAEPTPGRSTRSTPTRAPTKAGPRRPAATGCATGPGTWSSSSPPASPSPTPPSRSRTASAGPATPTWRRSWPGSGAGTRRSSTRPRWPPSARGSAARCW